MIPRIIAAGLWLACILLILAIALAERRDQAEAGNLLIRASVTDFCNLPSPRDPIVRMSPQPSWQRKPDAA